jgi:hypothetical protein
MEYIGTFKQNSPVSNVMAIPSALPELLQEDIQAVRNDEVNM